MNEKILYFDTETTDIQTKDIVQLAVIKNDGVTLNMFFNPIQKVSFSAMSIHHLTPEFLNKFKPFENAKLPNDFKDEEYDGNDLKEYLEYLSKEYIWVAHNAEFDAEVLEKKGISISKKICTFKLARNMFEQEGMDLESYSLQYLRYYLGLYKKENEEGAIIAHDAMGDVHVLKNLFEYLKSNSSLSTENMMIISKEPQFIRTINFGKYTGYSLEDLVKIDREYLEWLLENASDKKDLVYNVERVLSLG